MIFDEISNRFQLKFRDRESAGEILSEGLKAIIKKDERKNTIVLGIPRGGVIIADIIAKNLRCEFDIIIPRKLRAPFNKEIAIGAIMGDGTTYINETVVKDQEISTEYIQNEKLVQLEEIKRRSSIYCFGKRELEFNKFNFNNKTIILVDDGCATGATIIVATRWMKITKKPCNIILAVPIVPTYIVNLLKNEGVDQIEVITSPKSNFKSIEQYYKNFNQVTDEKVINILSKYQKVR